MIWTATIKSNSMDTLGRIVVNVIYSNGEKEIPESYTLDNVGSIKNILTDRLKQLQGIEDYLVSPLIDTFVPDVVVATNPTIPVQTQTTPGVLI